jgi:hypothetical protein
MTSRLFFSILSIIYIAMIFLWADSPVVSDLAPFNPYSLLHIPLYGILTFLLIFSFFPFNFKTNVPNILNDPNVTNERNASTHSRIIASTRNRFFISGMVALIVAIADEIYQSFIPTRDASILDVFLDFVGIVLVLFLVYRLAKGKYLFGFKLITDSMTQ